MATRFDWLEDVAKVVEAEARRPRFPGDGSFALPVLERLVNKLFGECHNGGEYGADGCAACRAYRTEKAEKVAQGAEKAVERAREVLAEKDTALAGANKDRARLEDKIRALEVEVVKANDLAGQFDRARQALQRDLAKSESDRGILEANLALSHAKHDDLAEQLEATLKDLTKLNRIKAALES